MLDAAERPGKAPPPWAKAIRSRGSRSSTPPKMTEQMARETSAGIPTSQGSQYLRMRACAHHVPGMHEDGGAQRLGAGSKTGKSAGSERFQSLTCEPICTPASPSSSTQRSSSLTASVGRLQGQRAEADEAARVLAADPGEVVVEQAREVVPVLRLRPVG